jgi:hypothetical protein
MIEMKKTIGIIIAAAFVLIFARACAAQEAVASIVKTQGKVETAAAGTEEWKHAPVGTALTNGMKIRTGREAEALVQWKQGHILKVFGMSTVTIDRSEMNGDKENTRLDINNGKVFVKAHKLASDDSKFEVKTPTAIAGVRGTEFMVEVSGESSVSTITLIQGQLDIAGEQVQTILEENTAITVNPDATTAPEPVAIDPATLTDLKDISSGIDTEIKDIETPSESGTSGTTGTTGTATEAPEPAGAAYEPDVTDIVDQTMNDTIQNVINTPPVETEPPPPNLPPLPPGE